MTGSVVTETRRGGSTLPSSISSAGAVVEGSKPSSRTDSSLMPWTRTTTPRRSLMPSASTFMPGSAVTKPPSASTSTSRGPRIIRPPTVNEPSGADVASRPFTRRRTPPTGADVAASTVVPWME